MATSEWPPGKDFGDWEVDVSRVHAAETGQGLIEYALILVLVVVLLVTALVLFQNSLSASFSASVSSLPPH